MADEYKIRRNWIDAQVVIISKSLKDYANDAIHGAYAEVVDAYAKSLECLTDIVKALVAGGMEVNAAGRLAIEHWSGAFDQRHDYLFAVDLRPKIKAREISAEEADRLMAAIKQRMEASASLAEEKRA